ncbi:GTP-binding protein [bacterium]|nr:GTP-binding protein [bacterium]
MAKYKTIPITLITGYLGSGKTTLINYLLKNAQGYKMAVIVNDIGEVNIDADLIEKGGIVSGKDENLVALQNGCICCTLKKDLMEQVASLINERRFDHILIEASGICEPVPIAQTLTYMEEELLKQGYGKLCKLDAIVSVVDAVRLKDEFSCGESLKDVKRGEEDIENLVIQQIEFCDVILLNKSQDVTKDELGMIKKVIKTIQPSAKIIECERCVVDLSEMLDTNLFDFEKASKSAGWIQEFENRDNEIIDDDDDDDDDVDHEEHHHHHHHHHEHGIGENDDEGTAEEYGISTYVYYRRKAFDKDSFTDWAETDFGRKVIRTKGIVYFTTEPDDVYIYEQAGTQKYLSNTGKWYAATLTKRQIEYYLKTDPQFKHDWDTDYGDRMIKLVFIGQDLDKKQIKKELDEI